MKGARPSVPCDVPRHRQAQTSLRALRSALVLASALCFVVAPAAAAPSDAAVLNEQGLALYEAQDYRHALEKFIGAHALESEPSLLFNIARCYEQLAQLDAALEKYRLFVTTARGEAQALARARASIEAIENTRRAAAAAARSSPPDAQPAPEPAATSSAASSSAAAGLDVRWLALGGSAAFVTLGITFYALGARDHARVSDLPSYGSSGAPADMTWRQAHALVDSGDTKKLVGSISLGLGGALAAGAVALFLSADQAQQQEAQLAVQPSLLRGGGALLLAGRFQ